jgi:hypothetical protein
MASLKGNQGNDKPNRNRNPAKPHGDRKDSDYFDMEGLQRVVKQLSNEIIELKKNRGEGTSSRGFFRFLDKRNFPPRQQTPPEGIHIQDYEMDKLCQVHKDNHSEKKCPSFINMFVLFMSGQENPPPSEETKSREPQENPS